jgi:hypothetical protein
LAAVTSLALIAAGSLVTTRTALFLLSNAILALLAADCPWFFAAAGASASDVAGACELPGGALQKQQAQRNQEEARRCAAKPRNRASHIQTVFFRTRSTVALRQRRHSQIQ